MNFVRSFGVAAGFMLLASGAWVVGCGGSSSSSIGADDAGSGASSSGGSSGTGTSGTGSGTTASSGTPSSGTTAASGTPSSGTTAASGTPSSGTTAASGTPSSGTATSGTPTSGTAASGTAASGTATSGTAASGTAASGTATSGSTPDAGTKPSPACATYCADVDGACAATADKQYASAAECLATCAILEATNGATGMDTIVCRTTHAGYAVATPFPHCWHAGPYGYGVCGDQCEAFCILADTVCAGTYLDCKTRCATFKKLAAPTTERAALGTYTASGPTTGNTLDCREYYLGLALDGMDKKAACANAGDLSAACK
jgi:hypothetical protein